MLLVAAVIKERFETLAGADPEVMRALRTDVQAGLEVLVVDELGASGALYPEPLGHTTWFFGRRRGDPLPRLLEPGHLCVLTQFKMQKSKMQKRGMTELTPFAPCILHFALRPRHVVLRAAAHRRHLLHQIVQRVVAAREIEL